MIDRSKKGRKRRTPPIVKRRRCPKRVERSGRSVLEDGPELDAALLGLVEAEDFAKIERESKRSVNEASEERRRKLTTRQRPLRDRSRLLPRPRRRTRFRHCENEYEKNQFIVLLEERKLSMKTSEEGGRKENGRLTTRSCLRTGLRSSLLELFQLWAVEY